jgi:PadR family transcriptional regulator, regulatory protein PadR
MHLRIFVLFAVVFSPLDNLDQRRMLSSRQSRRKRENGVRAGDIKQSGLVQGTLDMLILKTLALEPMHGYGIGVRIEQISKGVFQVNAGSLFPAIRRMERDGLIAGEWGATENNRRARYYALTTQGRAALKRETRDWERQQAAISRILKASPTEA